MFLVKKQVGNQNFSLISLKMARELIFKVPSSRALVAIAQNGNFEKLRMRKFKLLLGFLSFSENYFCSCCTGLVGCCHSPQTALLFGGRPSCPSLCPSKTSLPSRPFFLPFLCHLNALRKKGIIPMPFEMPFLHKIIHQTLKISKKIACGGHILVTFIIIP